MKKLSYRLLMNLLNSRVFNKLLIKFTNSKFSKRFIPTYIKKFKIDRSEILKPLAEFSSLNDFFIRQIDGKLRPIDKDISVYTSPCDGLLSELGQIDENNKFMIKMKKYEISDLLDKNEIQDLIGGQYGLIYLSPADYHRFHAITDCKVLEEYSRGDKSEPVNDMGLEHGDEPIVKNYRIIQKLEDARGKFFYQIYIGAVNVNSIVLHDKKSYKKGEEVGYFQFGSSIMLLFPKDSGEFYLRKDTKIKYGQRLFDLS